VGMTTTTLGLVGLGLALDDTLSWALVLPGSIAAGLGYGMAFPAWTIVGVERVPDERQGVASGLLVTTQEVGAAVGFAVMVAISTAVAGDAATHSAEGYRWAIFGAAVIAAAGAVASGLTPRVPAAPSTAARRALEQPAPA
jgi:MFS family permease